MKKRNCILLTSLLVMGCFFVKAESKTDKLPVIDFSKQYPKKELLLQDIADISYVPLETTDDVLLSNRAVLSCVTDNYILVHEFTRGDVFLFDRAGKIISHFSHKGQSGQEYPWIGSAGTILDEKNKEIYVCSRSIQVYSLTGEYKRTLKINTLDVDRKVFNFNDEALLVYDDVVIEPNFTHKTKKSPYRLISKKDGSDIEKLDLFFPVRYSNRMALQDDKGWRPVVIWSEDNKFYGRDFMIADMSSDTLLLLTQDKKLTPILSRKPSVHDTDPKLVWQTYLTTDRFVIIGAWALDFNSEGGRIPMYMYNFETKEIFRSTFLDAEFGMSEWSMGMALGGATATAKNVHAGFVQAESIINAYNKKQLNESATKFAANLDVEDNYVVRIIKFK